MPSGVTFDAMAQLLHIRSCRALVARGSVSTAVEKRCQNVGMLRVCVAL